MSDKRRFSKVNLKTFTNLVFLSLLFAIAYAQSPLYTSNQNQYFLHGFANAGYGYLDQDWLANTLDPTPIFSLLIEITQRYIGISQIYYLYYAVLMGIYLFSLLWISDRLFDIYKSRTRTLVLVAVLIVIHSAALRFTLSRTLGINWTYLLEDGVADQRMLGPVFQPSTFGVFLLLSIYLFLRRKPYLAVIFATLTAAIHPTYLLSAAVLTFAYMLVTYFQERNFTRPALIGLFALLLISPILYYVYFSFSSTSPSATARARDILVIFRIPHHTLVSEWFDATAAIKLALVLVALYLARKTHLFLILLVPTLAALFLTILQVVTDNYGLALLFPWRLSVFIVPLSITVILAFLVARILATSQFTSPKAREALTLFSVFIIFLSALIGAIRFKLDLDRQTNQAERAVLSYVYAKKSHGENYLIPIKMQDFRLVTGAPAYIEFKSIPYKDTDVLEWRHRVQVADNFYKSGDCNILEELSKRGQITHLVIETDRSEVNCQFMEELFADDHYRLMRLVPYLVNP